MKYIANIVTKSTIKNNDFIKVSKTIDEVDTSIPTLIIGWETVKEIYPNVNIIDKSITNTIFWTFNSREKRQDYEPDTLKFIKNVFKDLTISVKYTFFNILTSNLSKIKRFINYINSKHNKIIYITDKNCYIYDGIQVIGISVSDLEYMGISKTRIIKFIEKNQYNKIIPNDNFIPWEIKRMIDNNCKLIPFLYSLKEDVLF